MRIAAIVLSVPLIVEFVFAPLNLWTGRTIGNFIRFTIGLLAGGVLALRLPA